MVEKLTGKELIIKVLENSDKPMSHSEIWDVAIKSKYVKSYARGTDKEQKKAQIGSLLSTWILKDDCPIVRHEKGYNDNTVYTYSLNKNVKGNEIQDNIYTLNREILTSKNNNITKRHRQYVWNRDIGNSKSGRCYVCNNVITDDNFETGHIISKRNGGNNHVNNLRAVCLPCNRAMGTTNLEDFKRDFDPTQFNKDLYSNEITKEDVIQFLETHKSNDVNVKFFDKAIELLKNVKLNNNHDKKENKIP